MTANDRLSDSELAVWRAFERTAEAVLSHVEREVAGATGISAAEYRVLLRVAENGGATTQRDLALALEWDKSRISHQLTRMHARGLIKRAKSPETGSSVTLTRAGREALAAAQPVHAASVRRNLLARLNAEQRAVLARLHL